MSETAAKKQKMSVEQGSIYGMGNPLLDISAVVPTEFLDKYKVKLNDAILAEDEHKPIYQDLKDNFDVQYIAGGATQNSIRVAQWMLQETPQACSYVGCVGDDEFGKTLAKAASDDKVKVHYMVTKEEPTGKCAVLVNESERSLVTDLCAANKYSIEHLKTDETQALINKAAVYYMAGFFLTVSPESAIEVATHAAETKKIFSMNISAPFIVQVPPFFESLKTLVAKTDLLFGNESEAVAYAEAMKWETKDVAEIAVLAAKLPYEGGLPGGRTVCFTQGADATIVATAEGSTTYEVPKVAKEEIVDTNGAGDSFVGGYLSQLIKGEPVKACVDAGHYAAGVIIRHDGCTFPAKPDFK